MPDDAGSKTFWDSPKAISRRNFIKGVVAGGVAVSSASYLFRASTSFAQAPTLAGASERLITLNVNGVPRRVDVWTSESLG